MKTVVTPYNLPNALYRVTKIILSPNQSKADTFSVRVLMSVNRCLPFVLPNERQ